MLALLLACAPGLGPTPVMEDGGFFDRPWPSDTRTVDGKPDLSDFPHLGEYPLVDKSIATSETVEGFGTTGPIYLRIDGALDTDALPSPADSYDLDSPILLLDVDPHSPERGRLVPWQWDWQATETWWQPDNLLALMPLPGFPLRPHTSYAVVVRTSIARTHPAFVGIWDDEAPGHESVQELHETLFQIGLPPDDVAIATVFTTQDPGREMAIIADKIHHEMSLPAPSEAVELWDDAYFYRAYAGTVRIPLWQHGERPYSTEGGGFRFDEDGRPLLADWEDIEFTLTIPGDGTMPTDGWPVVIVLDGTGSDYRTFASGSPHSVAAVLARAGMAGFSISLPLHGDRSDGSDPELTTFNYNNPDAIRANLRQGGLDQVYLATMLAEQARHFTDRDGELNATLDPTRIGYLGHSQGGICGALGAPYFAGRVRAAVLSGTGGGTAISLIQRKQGGLDIEALLTQVFELDGDETLDLFHPITAIVQHLAETTDPSNYGPYWHAVEPDWETAPLDVVLTEGLLDEYTPPWTTEVLAAASGIPVLQPVEEVTEAADLLGLADQPAPTTDNLVAWDGTAVSGGLAQYPDEGHFAIYWDDDATDFYQQFLESAMSGEPEVPKPR